MRILLCDDKEAELPRREQLLRDGWKASGGGDLEVVQLGANDDAFATALEQLFTSVGQAVSGAHSAGTPFDGFDVVVIDNNLSELNLAGARHTAETICGWIRALSSAKYIVALDRSPVDFDLEYLVGDSTSLADLSVRSDHLALAGLWTRAAATGGFRPSYWPDLRESPARREKQILAVKGSLDQPIVQFFGFSSVSVARFSRAAVAALSPNIELAEEGHAKTIEDLTFRTYFIDMARSVPTETDRAALAANDDIVARVVAAEIEAWMRREILAPQDILVDLPHLLDRMPFLLAEPSTVDRWNLASVSAEKPFELNKELFEAHLAKWLRPGDEWIARPTFWWPCLSADEKLSEAYYAMPEIEMSELFYCEDLSKFVAGDENVVPSEFSMRADTPWNRRYVMRLENHEYAPRSQFAL